MNDIEFLKDLSQWPAAGEISYCCLRHIDGRLGYLLNGLPTVNVGNLFCTDDIPTLLYYDSMEAIVNDGWYVD